MLRACFKRLRFDLGALHTPEPPSRSHNRRFGGYETTMTLDHIDKILEQITYKPGWKLQWRPVDLHGMMGLRIWWTLRVPDAYDPTKMVTFQSAHVIPDPRRLDSESLVREVWRLTQRAELHEAGEFFMYGDERPFDPHRSVLEEGKRFG